MLTPLAPTRTSPPEITPGLSSAGPVIATLAMLSPPLSTVPVPWNHEPHEGVQAPRSDIMMDGRTQCLSASQGQHV